MCRHTFSSMKANIALLCCKIKLPCARQKASCYGMQHGGVLGGIGSATSCGCTRLMRQSQGHHMRTDGCDLPMCSLSRPYTIRPQVDDLCGCSQEAAQVVAGPKPRKHAAMLQP